MKMNNTTLLLTLSLAFISCKDEAEVRTYTEKRKTSSQHAAMMVAALGKDSSKQVETPKESEQESTNNGYAFQSPKTWKSKPSSSMRLASYLAGNVDISIIRLPGQSGDLNSNLQRWAGQVGLKLSGKELEEFIAKSPIAKRADDVQGRIYDFCPLVSEGSNCMVAVIYDEAGAKLFVKAIGPIAEILTERPNFHSFLKTLKPKE